MSDERTPSEIWKDIYFHNLYDEHGQPIHDHPALGHQIRYRRERITFWLFIATTAAGIAFFAWLILTVILAAFGGTP